MVGLANSMRCTLQLISPRFLFEIASAINASNKQHGLLQNEGGNSLFGAATFIANDKASVHLRVHPSSTIVDLRRPVLAPRNVCDWESDNPFLGNKKIQLAIKIFSTSRGNLDVTSVASRNRVFLIPCRSHQFPLLDNFATC